MGKHTPQEVIEAASISGARQGLRQVKSYTPTVNSYFSGAGGLDLGLASAGLKIQQSVEIEPVFAETLRNNFSHKVITDDIASMLVLKQDRPDVMAFTYPCKKYSSIADIHGTRTGDELYLHALRHVALARPEVYVLENVPGMKKFPVVMEAMSKLPDYYVHIFCPLDASTWLPQRRARLILFGTRKHFTPRPPEIKKRVKLKEILDKAADHAPTESVKARMRGDYRDRPIISDPAKDDLAPTCVAHYSKDRSTRLVVDRRAELGVRPYSVREYARLQGFPDSFNFSGTENQQFTQIGNAVAVPVGQWIGGELMRYFNQRAA
jgi:DNA (cytosine-5)-methyltransferase 1